MKLRTKIGKWLRSWRSMKVKFGSKGYWKYNELKKGGK